MTAPGINVSSTSAAPPTVGSSPTGQWFATGVTQRGAVGRPALILSMADFVQQLGGRIAASPLYDSAELFFRSGGSRLFVSRVTGNATAPATVVLKDRAAAPVNTLTVNANSGGAWGNGLSVAVALVGAGPQYGITVSLGGVVVEQSPVLSSPADAAAWSTTSRYVTILDQLSASPVPTNSPAVGTFALATGTDDNASITEATWTAALAVFTRDLGPGQVSAPGRTTTPAYVALNAHAQANNRYAYLDALDTPTAANLTAAAAATVATAGADGSFSTTFAGWVTIPGAPTGTPIPPAPRSVPPSALAAGVTAATDGLTYEGGICNPNVAPAGANGVAAYAIGVSQVYSDADRGVLNTAGIGVIRSIAGVVQLYGFRTMSADPTWLQANWSRLRMALTNDAQAIASNIAEFAEIDAKGQIFGRLSGALAGMLSQYYNKGALYGANANLAFKVNVGPNVNTLSTIAAGQINAVLEVKRSPSAEYVNILIANVPIAQPL
jgi:hypothetical protein